MGLSGAAEAEKRSSDCPWGTGRAAAATRRRAGHEERFMARE
jgi:hypothetical protein